MKSNLTLTQLANFGIDERQRDLLLADHAKLVAEHLHAEHSNVVGVGITANPSPNSQNDSVALVLLLKKEQHQAAALYGERSASGWKILYEVTGEIRPLNHAAASACTELDTPGLTAGFRAKYRPVPGGVSVSAAASGVLTGTIGCQVVSNGKTYMLSNNHILANTNRLSAGAVIIQPGSADGGSAGDAVGKLSAVAAMVASTPSAPVNNAADAAIAAYDEGIASSALLKKTDSTDYSLASPVVAASVGLEVQKSGRTTDYTTGKIKTIHLTIKMPYPDGKEYQFSDAFSIEPAVSTSAFSLSGDSGSIVSTVDGNHPVGLLFAGNSSAPYLSIANALPGVLAALKAANSGHDVTIKYN
jgi:hypothetical protein